MEVTLNGKRREIPDGLTVRGLVEHLGFGARQVVVERNGEPVERARFADTPVEAGDRLEVVRPVQGGGGELGDARLYLVTDGGLPPDVLEAVIASGVGMVQLREKDAEAVEVMEAAGPFQNVCGRLGVPFVVNDRPDIAHALGCGVHLGQGDLPPTVAREIVGPDALIGRSTHGPAQIELAVADHAAGLVDYIAVGPVYATPTKPGREPVGTDLVRYAADRVSFPWFAIGGINPSNVADVVEAGARRIVVVRAITESDDPPGAAQALRGALG